MECVLSLDSNWNRDAQGNQPLVLRTALVCERCKDSLEAPAREAPHCCYVVFLIPFAQLFLPIHPVTPLPVYVSFLLLLKVKSTSRKKKAIFII